MKSKQTIFFDLDGTLTDPKVGITRGVQYALAERGIAVDDPDSLVTFIGPPLAESFADLYGLDDDAIARAIEHYRVYYNRQGIFENVPYAGIDRLLEELKSNGRRLVVATSKPTVSAVRVLEHFGLAGYFDVIAGSNLDNTRTTKAEVIAWALSQLPQADVNDCVMIGDRRHDIAGARHHGMDAIGVLYGYGSEQEICEALPAYIARDIEELRQLLVR